MSRLIIIVKIAEAFLIKPLKIIRKIMKILEKFIKIAGQGDDYTTGCLLDYPYPRKNVSSLQ